MLAALYGWFERRVEPFPQESPLRPPSTLLAFIWHYAKPIWPVLALMSLVAALISTMEIMLFGFMGSLVDRLNSSTPESFWELHGSTMIWMALLVLIVLPLAVFLSSLLIHQSLLGNFPMIIRWQAHRYLLGQSLSFYQDEFAGRIATKIMQTSLSTREVVMKVLDVLVYVGVYFIGVLVLVTLSDYRLALPLVAWLAAYIALLRHYLPRLRKIAEAQADARSLMTGQLVDSYTNILTVKLFSQRSRETDYAKEGMDQFLGTVHRQMRQITSLFSLLYFLNCVLVFTIGATAIALWQINAVSIGAIAVAIGLVLRLNGMAQWIMWETSALFENIGTVEDGISTIE
ncbi:MAG: ABC transporter ATP-binding protein [Rhizobiales bacterium]|nr:ABC transporter ATP-binding protein [Hyphomicrobiales bacterium]